MRRLLPRNGNLILPFVAVLAIGVLAGLGWQRSMDIRKLRAAAHVSYMEARFLSSVSQTLGEAERAQHRYLLDGLQPDLALYQTAANHLDSLSVSLTHRLASDSASGVMLPPLMKLVDARKDVLTREASHRLDPLIEPVAGLRIGSAVQAPPDLPHGRDVLQQLRLVSQSMERLQRARTKAITYEIRILRWLGALVALIGGIGLFGVIRLLRGGWKNLIRAETDQRMLALQLRATLDSLSQGVAVFSEAGLLLNWNMRLCRMLDLPLPLLQPGLAYETLGKHLAGDGVPFLEPIDNIHTEAPGAGEARPVVYERLVRPHAGHGETQIEIRRTLMPQGGFVLSLTDITERVQTERMMHQAQKMQALGQLTGGIAHDFNNMLTVILGSLDIAAAEIATAGCSKAATLIHLRRAAQAGESGAALTRQLLKFARRQPLAPVPVDLSVQLPELMPLLRHTIGSNIAVIFQADPGLWPAMTDACQMESAVLNLVLNARDAMPEGGTLTIEARNVSPGLPGRLPGMTLPAGLALGDYVRLSVRDSGHGMSVATISRAFEPFFTTKPEGRGTGLGLPMVSRFARQSGGLAAIQSEPGHGTTITLYLPRAMSDDLPGVARDASEAEPGSSGSIFAAVQGTSGLRRILVVEDDALVRQLATEMLRELGYRVSEASNAEQALRLMKNDPAMPEGAVDLLLTDIMLPGALDGRALATLVRKISPGTRVLYMSGDAEGVMPPDLQHTVTGPQKPDRCLGKPFRRAQLAAEVEALIGTSHAGSAAYEPA